MRTLDEEAGTGLTTSRAVPRQVHMAMPRPSEGRGYPARDPSRRLLS